MGKIDVVVGGQFGSEAKGHVTQRVVQRRTDAGEYTLNVRVAGPNAGHTVIDPDGEKWAMRQLPVGFAIKGMKQRHKVTLAIAAGSEIDPAVLIREIDQVQGAGLLHGRALWVDPEATVIEPSHVAQEAIDNMVGRLGSTGKGVGAARAERIMRRARRVANDPELVAALKTRGVIVETTEEIILDHQRHQDCTIVVEGTQGFGLGLHSGFYPKTTSSDCRAIDFLAMAGINPWAFQSQVIPWVVLRPYPIRVAGDSGPLYGETTWEKLSLPEEKTTVTQKVRRVGAWDQALAMRAVEANGGADCRVAITMLDQVFPALAGCDSFDILADHPAAAKWLSDIATQVMTAISLVTTSDRTGVWLR